MKIHFREDLDNIYQIKKSALNDTEEWISEDLKDIMGEWQFPFHFIDFETCTVALFS